MICFEDNFALLWLYCLKLLLQLFRDYHRLFFLSCPTTKISSFDFTSPFIVSCRDHKIILLVTGWQLLGSKYQFLREHGECCCECNWNVYCAWPFLALIFVLHSLAFARICNWMKQWNPTEGTFTDWWLLFGSSLFCLSWLLHFLYYYIRNFCNLIGLEQWYFK